MSGAFRALPGADLAQGIEDLLLPRLTEALHARAPGHCMRVSDLGRELMAALARALRRQVPKASVHVLTDDATTTGGDLYVSSTKLVELRNPLPDGSLRPPLCIFLPANLRTSAEDSFGSATFEEFPVGGAYDALRQRLLERAPSPLQGYVRDLLQLLGEQRWRWADAVAQVRYLLCAHANGSDGEAFGGALYELGLIPDFRLFDDPSAAYGRVRKNHECVRQLTDGDSSVLGRVLDLDLASKGMRRRLTEYLAEAGLEDPVAWTRDIVLDRQNWDLSFDKWDFASEIVPDKIAFVRVETDLPLVSDEEHENDRLAGLVGQQVLAPSERRKMGVVMEVSPHPRQVRGLDHFSVQIVSREAGPVGASCKVRVWRVARPHASVSLPKLHRVEFEEGWHYVRVLAWTADGDPIPVEEPDEHSARRANESEPFYVLPDAALEEEPAQRAVPRADSIEHARLERQFTAVVQRRDAGDIAPQSVGWTQRSTARRVAAQETIEAKFGKEGTLHIVVARWLKNIERRILETPERPVSWRMQIHAGQPEMPAGDIGEWMKTSAVREFLEARSAYFKVVAQESGDMVSQGLDVLGNAETVLAYAAAYVEVLEDLSRRIERETGADQLGTIVSLRAALAVDTVRLIVEDYRGHFREAALVAPTHPLRALWQLAWAQLGAAWVREAAATPNEHVAPAGDALLHGLSSINFPSMLPVSDGRVFSSVDNIHPFWPLYAPATEDDPRGLLGDICAALGVPEPSIGGAAITGAVLASRIERYLIQHPYVRTLAVNAFNPGRANVLADALAALQRQDAFQHLRYDVRLFVPDPDAPGVGESIDALLSGRGTAASEAFATPTASHIFPKISVAVRSTADFRSEPARFRSHLGILFDVFPPEDMGAGRPLRTETTIPLHGLIQEFTTRFHDGDSGTWWQRQPRHGVPAVIEGGEEASLLLGKLPALISSATATVARSTPDFASRPIIRLELDSSERALINEVHDASDWVLTIDRNMGIEFFDHGGRRDRPDYLIDYTPSTVPEHGHRLIVSSRSLAELEAMLRPVLRDYGLDTYERNVVVVLDQLRSLSGRLALKLVSGPTAQAEALGMALARLFLEYQGALRNQIVVPLDAHIDLFRTAQSYAEAVGDEVTLHRTDLALFDLDLAKRTVSCNLVEVKCYAQRLGLSGYAQLKERITEQLNRSERVLQRHFDPQRTMPDRPDRLLKTRELATLLEFYLNRSVRYGLMEGDAGDEAQVFLDRLEEGYTLRFSRSGVVFDFDKPGTEPAEHETGIEFHRVGSDLIRRLVEHATDKVPEPPSAGGGDGGGVSVGDRAAARDLAPPPIPRLDSAAFLVADRARSTSDLEAEGLPRQDREDRQGAESMRFGAVSSSGADEGSSVATIEEPATPGEPAAVGGSASAVAQGTSRMDSRFRGSDGTQGGNEGKTGGNEGKRGGSEGQRSGNDGGLAGRHFSSFPRKRESTRNDEAGEAPHEAGASPADGLPILAGEADDQVDHLRDSQPDAASPPSPRYATAAMASAPEAEPPEGERGPGYDATLGVTTVSPQFGLLGESSGRKVALDLNQTHTISLFGVQGGGKSYTLGSIVEMACMAIPGVNALPRPLAGVIFHYSSTLDYPPEFTSMAAPNGDDAEVKALRAQYGAAPQGLEDLVILTPSAKVEERRAEYPGTEVLPIAFAASELKASHWKFLMGAVGSQSMYIRQLALIMKKLRGEITLDALRRGVQESGLSDYLKDLALLRLRFAEEYIDDAHRLTDVLHPGRLVIVDLRDELIEKDEALGLFVVLLQMFADTTFEGRRFNKLVVFDEAHKYIGSPDLVAGLVEVVREMRHKGTSVMVASQDPPSVPTSLIELSTQIVLHKFNSPAWLKHLQKANAALDVLSPAKLASLGPGEAYLWSSKATDDAFTRGAVKVRCRPRVTQHGGETKTALRTRHFTP